MGDEHRESEQMESVETAVSDTMHAYKHACMQVYIKFLQAVTRRRMRWVPGGYHMIKFVPSAADMPYVLGMQCGPFVQRIAGRLRPSTYLYVRSFMADLSVSEAAFAYRCIPTT